MGFLIGDDDDYNDEFVKTEVPNGNTVLIVFAAIVLGIILAVVVLTTFNNASSPPYVTYNGHEIPCTKVSHTSWTCTEPATMPKE
jgi:hypothetical protein